MGKTILVIPDSHAKPGVSNERFTWLGRLIVDIKPDIIVNLGDMADMPSLSLFDVGKKSFEGRRVKADLASVHDALNKLQEPIDQYNKSLKDKKLKQYRPRKVITLGNHEYRLARAIESDAKLEGTLSMKDYRYEEFGWEVIPFKVPVIIEGITFQHLFTQGLMDRPIGGDNLGRTILKRYHTSALQGHTHILNVSFEANSRGDLLIGGSLGCYMEHKEDYVSQQAQNQWWRGITILGDTSKGVVKDLQFITLDSIKNRYR